MSLGHSFDSEYSTTHGTELRVIEQIIRSRDLGIQVSDDLNWSIQCNQAASKAMAVLGMIKRAFGYVSEEIFTISYSTYITPNLEYCVQAWASYYQKDIETLEKVQRQATKLVKKFNNLSYKEIESVLYCEKKEKRRHD